MQVRKISLSTGELTYFVAGEGRTILYLHAAGGVRWTRVLEGLAKWFRLTVPVIPGFDGRGAPRAAAFDRQAHAHPARHRRPDDPERKRPASEGPPAAVLSRIRLGRRARDRGRSARAHALAGGKFSAALRGLHGQLGHAR